MKNKITLFVSFLAGILLLGSCLKDKVGDYWVDELAGKMYATVPTYTLQQLALKPVAGDIAFSFLVNIATDALPTEDITLTLAVDAAAVTQYNKDHSKTFLTFPTVQVLTSTITIAKGTRNATVNAKVWGAETLNACDNYMTAVSIKTAKTASGKDVTIAGNMKSYLLALPISNPFEGIYHAAGVFTHPVNGPRDIDEDKELNTIDCKTVTCSAGDLGGDKGTWVTLTVNADNTITFGGSLSSSQPYKPQVGKDNKYVPASKTFILNYYYEGATGNRLIQETIVRK
jgi:hypothetical protein